MNWYTIGNVPVDHPISNIGYLLNDGSLLSYGFLYQAIGDNRPSYVVTGVGDFGVGIYVDVNGFKKPNVVGKRYSWFLDICK